MLKHAYRFVRWHWRRVFHTTQNLASMKPDSLERMTASLIPTWKESEGVDASIRVS